MSDALPGETCDACGLPPVHPKRLHQCTRCKRAYYHDRRCQQSHYPKHKAVCRRIAAASKDAGAAPARIDAPARKPSLVECVSVEGRGRSLIATAPLEAGCHPLSSPATDGLCAPIAHPVLIESLRQVRCAYCFQAIQNARIPALHASALHSHCSQHCRNSDENWLAEAHAARKLPHPISPTALSCSRVLRKFHASPATLKEYNELCCSVELLSDEEKKSYLDIMTKAHAILCAMGDSAAVKISYDLVHPDPTPAYEFMSRLDLNGFTIATVEMPLGHGIFCGASMINHSCRPNAVPTFWLRAGTPPMLQITACQSIEAGDEVTIGYCDASTPRFVRKEYLWTSYKFQCNCLLCNDDTRDDELVGLKCTKKRCEGRVRSVEGTNNAGNIIPTVKEVTLLRGGAENKLSFRCDACGCTDFDEALKVQADSMRKIKRLELKLNRAMTSGTFDSRIGEEAKKMYECLKRHCDLQRSFYVAWSADLFVNWCANALQFLSGQQEQLSLCSEALSVINQSRSATKFCYGQCPGYLSWHTKRGIEAKLRLFLNPMDMEALAMLQDVRKQLLLYYPPSDDVISSLDDSLRSYSFS
ncbi:hypothetical protein ACHAWF_003385 [Thalassiosira exigua]